MGNWYAHLAMNRREYLVSGGAIFTVGLAGCAATDGNSSQSDDDSDDGTGSEETGGTTEDETTDSLTVDELRVPEAVEVGEEFVATVLVSNAGDQERTYSGTLTVTGEEISAEEELEETIEPGATVEIEGATITPECEEEVVIELVDEGMSGRVSVNPYPTPRSEVDDHRYGEQNTGMTDDPGPASQIELVEEYEAAISHKMRFNEDTAAMVTSTSSLGNGEVQVIERGSGEALWSETLQFPSTEPALFDGRLYLVDANDLVCYDVETGEKHWEFTDAGPPSNEVAYSAMYGTPLVSDGTVYFNGMHGHVWALNAYSGCEQWSTSPTPDGTESIAGIPSVQDEMLYIVGDDGVSTSSFGPLYALNKQTGEVEWESDEDDIIGETTPVNGSHVYVRTLERDGLSTTETIRAYDTETGGIDWERELGTLDTAPVVDDDHVYVGRSWPTSNANGELVALDRSSGAVEWRMEPEAGIVDAPSVGGNALFVMDWDETLYSVVPESGDLNWTVYELAHRATPLIHDDRLYLTSIDPESVGAFE